MIVKSDYFLLWSRANVITRPIERKNTNWQQFYDKFHRFRQFKRKVMSIPTDLKILSFLNIICSSCGHTYQHPGQALRHSANIRQFTLIRIISLPWSLLAWWSSWRLPSWSKLSSRSSIYITSFYRETQVKHAWNSEDRSLNIFVKVCLQNQLS